MAEHGETSSAVQNGGVWKDVSGEVMAVHGGGILRAEGYYYWFGENRIGNRKVSCYRSSDLIHWEFRADVLTTESPYSPIDTRTNPDLKADGLVTRYGEGATIERPKVLYNEETGKYVMWMHWENGRDYRDARCAVASCATVDGEYTYHGSFNPAGYMSRDCTLFKDEDGTAYFISAARDNADLHVYRLSRDYLSIDEHVKKLWPGQYREAPALFKRGGLYYMITSACTGWRPNQAKYAYAESITGRWSSLMNLGDATTYQTQPAFVLPVQGSEGTGYLYIGDRWDPDDYYRSTYVFLPLEFPEDRRLELNWADAVSIDAGTGRIWRKEGLK
jgi:hypothetical protein